MKKINLGQKEIIHFVGIGGIGMSGLAQVMKNMGFNIQGSDQQINKNTISCKKLGIKIFKGHAKKNVKNGIMISNIIKKFHSQIFRDFSKIKEIENIKYKISRICSRVEYLEIRNKKNLKTNINKNNFKIFIAYYLDNVRLIDNF